MTGASGLPESGSLARFARELEAVQWAAYLLDADHVVRWVSPELRAFLDTDDEQSLGYGRHLLEAFLSPTWSRTITPDSRWRVLVDLAPFLAHELAHVGMELPDSVPREVHEAVAAAQPRPMPPAWSTRMTYRDPRGEHDATAYDIHAFGFRVPGADASDPGGWAVITHLAVPPRLLALLGRGDRRVHERMARLVQPGRREAAILFCDLEGSGPLSRRLPSAEYFRLIRRLWTAIDGVVGDLGGIVGKHAGDGATAFFLVDELGGDSAAAAAALSTAGRVHELSAEIFADLTGQHCLMKVGVHWGASLYMGQLVPGGRLDVTALGDEVNEAARIQEAAGAHETLASKPLVERLSAEDARRVGIDPAAVSYRLLADIAPDRGKVVRDAGGLAVTALPGGPR